MSDIYKEALEAARTEFEELSNEESRLEDRLQENRKRQVGLKKSIESLTVLVGEETDERTVGITAAIREVLRSLFEEKPKSGFTPTGIRTHLQQRGFQIDAYKNPLAVIHTTLKRLADQNEIKTWEKDDKTYYRWLEPEITDDDIPF